MGIEPNQITPDGWGGPAAKKAKQRDPRTMAKRVWGTPPLLLTFTRLISQSLFSGVHRRAFGAVGRSQTRAIGSKNKAPAAYALANNRKHI